MAAHHYEIRDGHDTVVCAVDIEAPVKDVEGVKSGDTVAILLRGDTTAVGYPTQAQAQAGEYRLYRWPLEDRSGDPKVTKIS